MDRGSDLIPVHSPVVSVVPQYGNVRIQSTLTEDDYPVYDAFWEAIAECHSLKKLDIPYIAKEKKHSSVFLTLCQMLSVLSLTIMDSQYLPTKDMPPSTRFPKMKQLSLKSKVRGTVSEATHFICHCPNISHLEMDSLENSRNFSYMTHDLTARLWKELIMASCLSAMNFGPECSQFLVNPTNRVWACQIREIIIKGGGQIGSSKVVQALTICSGLRKFDTSHIDVRDMISTPADYNPTNLRPWVCIELEELRAEFGLPTSGLRFDIGPVTPAYHRSSSLVFTQTAALKRLCRLDLRQIPDSLMGAVSIAHLGQGNRVADNLDRSRVTESWPQRLYRIHTGLGLDDEASTEPSRSPRVIKP
ncbi:hypothetical protein BGZ82_008833 [Podila clonocystis]|nr:hypothetical protein BGZ82_008833 [Podila clonocystis]